MKYGGLLALAGLGVAAYWLGMSGGTPQDARSTLSDRDYSRFITRLGVILSVVTEMGSITVSAPINEFNRDRIDAWRRLALLRNRPEIAQEMQGLIDRNASGKILFSSPAIDFLMAEYNRLSADTRQRSETLIERLLSQIT